jgi:ubiquitin carboxyl-terminal hydrolase L5
LLKQLGLPLIVDDLYTLDSESLQALQPLHALIFLFKWLPTTTSSSEPNPTAGKPDPDFPGFFAHQVVNNACATLAVLNGVLNIEPTESGPLPMSSELADLVSFTTGMDPQTRGLAVTSADWLRAAHNALSPPAAVSLDGLIDKSQREKEDAYHFVVYVPVHGAVYELDGLQPFPINHGPWAPDAPDGWLSTARAVVERRIATYPAGALEFNLQAVRADPLPRLRAQLADAQKAGAGLAVAETAAALADEEAKRERWAVSGCVI